MFDMLCLHQTFINTEESLVENKILLINFGAPLNNLISAINKGSPCLDYQKICHKNTQR